MTTRTSTVEDLESGKDKEFERIKQNFASTPNRNTSANPGETQLAFQSLQSELQEFLVQHLLKITSFQEDIARGITSNDTFDGQRSALSPRASQLSNGGSHHAMEDDHSEQRPPKLLVTDTDKALVDVHMRNLQGFLVLHVENIRRLQDLGLSPSVLPVKEHLSTTHSEVHNNVQAQDWSMYKMAQLNIGVSTVMAILIVMFLLLVISIIGLKHRTPFSVTMFFAFLALSPLFVAVFTAKLVPIQSQPKPAEVNFYLHICEQLQLVATGLFVISIVIAMFFIFVSLAFPFVILALSGIGALVVFMSIHWEVAITLGNILYLLKNIRRLGTVVHFVRYNRKAPAPAVL